MREDVMYPRDLIDQLLFLRRVLLATTAAIDALVSAKVIDMDEPIPKIEKALMQGLSLTKVKINIVEDFADEPLDGEGVIASLLRVKKDPSFSVGLTVKGSGRIA